MARRLPALCLLSCLAALAGAGPAHAAFAQRVGPALRFTAAPRELNLVSVKLVGSSARTAVLRTTDANATVAPGDGCTQSPDEHTVDCPAAGVTQLSIATGDRDDEATNETRLSARLDGGAGDDVLTGGRGRDVLLGGPGDDTLAGGPGPDTFRGGPGRDAVSYLDLPDFIPRRDPVVASIGGARNGTAREGDRIARDVESVYGGAGNDRIHGGPTGGTLLGNAGADRITGGPGVDAIAGGAGDDLIASRDRVRDFVGCGAGGNVVLADPLDEVGMDCALVRLRRGATGVRSAVAAFPSEGTGGERSVSVLGGSVPVARGGLVAVRVSCPSGERATCRGIVVLSAGGSLAGRRGARVRPGASALVRVRLSKVARKSLGRGRRTYRAAAVPRPRGTRGRRSTIFTLRRASDRRIAGPIPTRAAPW